LAAEFLPVRDGKVFCLDGRIAAFVAMAVLFLHTSCIIGLTLFADQEANASPHSACHEPEPATPDAPNSGQKCCNGVHSPEALLTTGPTELAPFISTELSSSSLFGTGRAARLISDIATTAYGPPLPSVLRI
jgi:hypothetical protein